MNDNLLMLIDKIKRCIHRDISTFLDDQTTTENASRLADGYAFDSQSLYC